MLCRDSQLRNAVSPGQKGQAGSHLARGLWPAVHCQAQPLCSHRRTLLLARAGFGIFQNVSWGPSGPNHQGNHGQQAVPASLAMVIFTPTKSSLALDPGRNHLAIFTGCVKKSYSFLQNTVILYLVSSLIHPARGVPIILLVNHRHSSDLGAALS